jgi:putative ABC transport system permease protein
VNVFPGVYRGPTDSIGVFAVDSNFANVFPDLVKLSPDAARLQNVRRGALVGNGCLSSFGWGRGQEIGVSDVSGTLHATLQILGVAGGPLFNWGIVIQRDYLQAILQSAGNNRDYAALLDVRVDGEKEVGPLSHRIDEQFKNSGHPTLTLTENQLLQLSLKIIGNIRKVTRGLCLTIVITMLLVSGNTMAMSVRDRLSDVAVMRALGFSQAAIAFVIATEAFVIGATGGFLATGALAWFFRGPGIPLPMVLNGILEFAYLSIKGSTILMAFGCALLARSPRF